MKTHIYINIKMISLFFVFCLIDKVIGISQLTKSPEWKFHTKEEDCQLFYDCSFMG